VICFLPTSKQGIVSVWEACALASPLPFLLHTDRHTDTHTQTRTCTHALSHPALPSPLRRFHATLLTQAAKVHLPELT
jgi:hypothetical protein